MYQRDYILRMLEMLADLIAGILGMLKKGRFEEAERAVENAYYEFLKQDAAVFRTIPKKMLTSEVLHHYNYTHGHLEILSELFFAEAEVKFYKQEFSSSLEFYEKSLILLDYVTQGTESFSIQKQERITYLCERINELMQTNK